MCRRLRIRPATKIIILSISSRPGLLVGKQADQRLHPQARLFHSRLGHFQDSLGEMGPLAPAASSHLAGLGHCCGDYLPKLFILRRSN